ncbi:serine hydrolase [Streptomyces nigrescens]
MGAGRGRTGLLLCQGHREPARVHLLVQEGRLDLDAPMSRYWPGFAQHGKDVITCRMTPRCPDVPGCPPW